MSPLHIGIEPVVGRAALILVAQTLFGRGFALAVHLDDALGAEFHVGMDKDFKTVGGIAQDVVGAAANDDARFFLGKIGDDLVLDFPQIILVGGAESAVPERRGQTTAGCVLTGILDVVFVESAPCGNLANELVVVAGNTQFFCGLFADCSATAAKFPADGDDSVFHIKHTRFPVACSNQAAIFLSFFIS